jgi:transposase
MGRRSVKFLKPVSFDQRSFKCSQSYIVHLRDLKHPRVLEVVEGRGQQSAGALRQSPAGKNQRNGQRPFIDRSAKFSAAAHIEAPQARVAHDKIQVLCHLNEAIDESRRAKHKALFAQGGEALKSQRVLFLFDRKTSVRNMQPASTSSSNPT